MKQKGPHWPFFRFWTGKYPFLNTPTLAFIKLVSFSWGKEFITQPPLNSNQRMLRSWTTVIVGKLRDLWKRHFFAENVLPLENGTSLIKARVGVFKKGYFPVHKRKKGQWGPFCFTVTAFWKTAYFLRKGVFLEGCHTAFVEDWTLIFCMAIKKLLNFIVLKFRACGLTGFRFIKLLLQKNHKSRNFAGPLCTWISIR